MARVITGEYLKVVPLNAGQKPAVEMDVAADSAAALDAPAEVWEHYKNLVKQTDALFGAQHYRDYHFLYSLSDHVAHFGLEHHESNDSRLGERALVDPTKRLLGAGLLSHEFVHSWNGKYRRPADLATPDYEKPMQTDLLWVYEGLTEYLGEILTGRMGERTPEEFRDALAYTAAMLDHTPGRAWRNLQDTADGVPAMQDAPHQWESWRRGLDYYDEDELNWLWADTIIRQRDAWPEIPGRLLPDFPRAPERASAGEDLHLRRHRQHAEPGGALRLARVLDRAPDQPRSRRAPGRHRRQRMETGVRRYPFAPDAGRGR